MIYEDQITLSLLTACVMQQNQLLKRQNAMLLERLNGMESVGDRLWRMDRRLTTPPVDQAGTRKRAAKKRRLSRRPSGKKA